MSGSRTLVSDMSLSLADNASAAERKNAQEQLSGWLQRYDSETVSNEYLMARAKPLVGRTTTLDFADAVWAAWRRPSPQTAEGRAFPCPSVVGPQAKTAIRKSLSRF